MKISIPYFKFISNLLQGTFRWVKEPCWPIVVGNWHIFKVLRLVQMCIMDTNHVSVLRPRSRGNVRGYIDMRNFHQLQIFFIFSPCYKTILGGNQDFPKTKKMKMLVIVLKTLQNNAILEAKLYLL